MAARSAILKRPFLVLGVIVLSVLLIAAWRFSLPREEKLPPFPTESLRVGIDPSYPPFAFGSDNGYAGIDVDLANALGEQIGLPVHLEPMGIDGLYDAILTNKVDVVISSLQVEAWRLGDIAYTRSYLDTGLMLVTPQNSPIQTVRDLSGHSLAYEFGSSADAEARAWLRRIQPFDLRPYELPGYALDAIRLEQADAALVDFVTLRLYQREHPGWQINTVQVTSAPYVIAVHFHRFETFKIIDDTLQTLIDDGTVEALLRRWL